MGSRLRGTLRETDDATPIIFLTAKSLKEDKVEGFRIGCDDYVTKPFSMEELMLRIRAVLRRAGPSTGGCGIDAGDLRRGEIQFDQSKRTLRAGGKERRLTSREAELLRLLCLHKNRVLERDVALRIHLGERFVFQWAGVWMSLSRGSGDILPLTDRLKF